jgi:hypothetical protein
MGQFPAFHFQEHDCSIDARRIARAGDVALAPWLSLCEGRKVNRP